MSATKHIREPSRTRQHGTIVTNPSSPEERISAIRQIVQEKQYAKIDGMMVDLFTASLIVNVYNALSPEHQVKYMACPVGRMAALAMGQALYDIRNVLNDR